MDWKIFAAAPLAAALLVASAAPLSPLNGWSSGSTGKTSKAYAMGIDSSVQFQGQRSVSVQSQEGLINADSYGAVIQNAFGYPGRRVRFSGWMRSADVKQWAGAFVRVDADGTERFFGSGRSDLKTEDLPFGAGSTTAQDRWTEVSIVVDVPNTPAAMASVGAVVVGEGKVWLSAMRFEEVGPEVALTTARIGMPLPTAAQREAEARRLAEKATRRVPPNLSLE